MADDLGDRDQWLFSFSGRLEEADLLERPSRLVVQEMREKARPIAEEICLELERRLPGRFESHIDFTSGSVIWSGVVAATITWMANIGGAIGLVQIIATTITAVLQRYIPVPIPLHSTSVLILQSAPTTVPGVLPAPAPLPPLSGRASVSPSDLGLAMVLLIAIEILVGVAFAIGMLVK